MKKLLIILISLSMIGYISAQEDGISKSISDLMSKDLSKLKPDYDPKIVDIEYDNLQKDFPLKNGKSCIIDGKDSIPFTGVCKIYNYDHDKVGKLCDEYPNPRDYYELLEKIKESKSLTRYLFKELNFKDGIKERKQITYSMYGSILKSEIFVNGVLQTNDVANKILSKEKLTIDYIENNCVDLNTLKGYNINSEDTKLRYYIKMSANSDRDDNARLVVGSGINFEFNVYSNDAKIEDQFYRPIKTVISKASEYVGDYSGLYITFPSIPSETVVEFNHSYYQFQRLKINNKKDKETLLEFENLINYESGKISIYLITASDLRKGDKNKDNVKLYIKQAYRYRLRDYFIANKVRMVIINNETGKLYYDNLFVPVITTKKKK